MPAPKMKRNNSTDQGKTKHTWT